MTNLYDEEMEMTPEEETQVVSAGLFITISTLLVVLSLTGLLVMAILR